ncbi:MAG: TIGR01212 family radical SAM protein [Candidatus Omnitrophota bacterium]|nr:TIGR01212 family radical SAM protein [Candidatus Omnitrophota bacterium]
MRYYSFKQYVQETYGENVKKIGLNAGFGCPNRIDEDGLGGCIFCNEEGYSNYAGQALSLDAQISGSIKEMKKRRDVRKFIAYFQNGTSTNAEPSELKRAYDVIRGFPEIIGLSISTRPDCVDDEKLDLIAGYMDDYDVWVEYGMQSLSDDILRRMNRGHTSGQTIEAIERTAKRGIKVGVHIMIGGMGQSREDIIKIAERISGLPVDGVKLHMLHVLKNTPMEKMYESGSVRMLSLDEYAGYVCDFIEHLRSDCVIMRLISDAKRDLIVAPRWMEDKLEAVRYIEREMEKRGVRQGSMLS